MRARKLNQGGVAIFIPSQPDPYGNPPKKEPYIIFKMANDPFILRDLDQEALINLGLWEEKDNEVKITITSARKVMAAIDLFCSTRHAWFNPKDAAFLKEYKKEIAAAYNSKDQKNLPLKSDNISQFKIDENNYSFTFFRTALVTKQTPSKKQYVLKYNDVGRSISEIEAFNGFCYRLLLGARHPKVKGVHNDFGTRVGVISEILPGFVTIAKRATRPGGITKDLIIQTEMIKIWVAAYVEEEADLHFSNYGVDETGYCVKIDDDRSTWPITAKYTSLNAETGYGAETAPNTDFTVAAEDIETFPFLKIAHPKKWFNTPGGGYYLDEDIVKACGEDKKFNDDMFYTFLKRILISKEMYEAIGLATIASPKTMQKLVDHKCNKTASLRCELLKVAKFRQYIIDHPDVIEKIVADVEKYNQDYKRERDKYLQVDTTVIRKNFAALQQDVSKRVKDSLDPFAIKPAPLVKAR